MSSAESLHEFIALAGLIPGSVRVFDASGVLTFDSGSQEGEPATRVASMRDHWVQDAPRWFADGNAVPLNDWAPVRALAGESVCHELVSASGNNLLPEYLSAVPILDNDQNVIAILVVRSQQIGSRHHNDLRSIVHALNNILNPLVQLSWLLEQNAEDADAVKKYALRLSEILTSATQMVARMVPRGAVSSGAFQEPGEVTSVSGAVSASSTSGTPQQNTIASKRVLIVEDHDEGRSLLAKILIMKGLEVDAVGSFTEACTSLRSSVKYDVMLSDVLLPDGTGSDLVHVARQTQPEIRVGLISGAGFEVGGGIDADADFFLNKPLRAADLIDAMRQSGKI